MIFPDFNKTVNPLNERMYIAKCDGQPNKRVNYNELVKLAIADMSLEILWEIPDDYAVVIIERNKLLEDLLISENSKVLLITDMTEAYIITKDSKIETTVNNVLACGAHANTLSSGETFLLPFKNKAKSTSTTLKTRNVIYSNTIGELPYWLQPTKLQSSPKRRGLSIPLVNTQQDLIEIGKFTYTMPDYIKNNIIDFVNARLTTTPLSDEELEIVVNYLEALFVDRFFEKKDFLHHKLGNFIIGDSFVKMDRDTKELFFYDYANNIYCNDTNYLMGRMTRLCPSLKNFQKEEVLKYIQSYLFDDKVSFNTNEFSIVFQNCLLDVTTMKTLKMSHKHLESIKINCNYNPNATSAVADEFFKTATGGNKDIEQLLYEVIGYTMLKTNELQKAFILVGIGRNGKSTYFDVIKAILGKDNTTAISFKDLANNFRASSLTNKLASIAGDISSQPIQDTDFVKSIVSGEEIMLEEKYKAAYQKSLFSTMLFACNKLPYTPDTSDGFFRRFTIIPFIAKLDEISRVEGMQFKKNLLAPESLEYIAYKAVNAIYKVLEVTRDFIEPTEVKEMLLDYKTENSSVLSWFKDSIAKDKVALGKMTLGNAYANYVIWCGNNGRHKVSQTTFDKSLKVDIGVTLK